MTSEAKVDAPFPRMYSPYDRPMWDSIAEKKMRLQRCVRCQRFRYPPGACCPGCLSTEATWEPISGLGKIVSWTTFHRQYLPAYPAPLTCVAVQLDEGPMVVSNVDAEEIALLRLDAPARMIYGRHPDGYVLPRFTVKVEGSEAGTR